MNTGTSTTALVVAGLLAWMTGPAFAQEPGECVGDTVFEGGIRQIIDTSDGTIYAVGDGGLYWSCDDGVTWTGGGHAVGAISVVRDPRDSTKVIVGYDIDVFSGNTTGTGDMPEPVNALIARQDGTLLAGGNDGIYMSRDFGEHWTLIEGTDSSYTANGTSRITAMLVDPNIDQNVMASARLDSYRSTDGGFRWDAMTASVPSDVRDFEVGPTNSTVIWAAAEQWLLRSADSGYTWEQIKYARVEDLAFDPTNPAKAYYAGSGGNIAYTTNGGNYWRYVFDEWDFDRIYARSIFVASNGRVIAGTNGDGIHYSNDGGESWTKAEPASPDAPPPDDPTSGLADIRISIQRAGHDGTVDAGSNAGFTVTITNRGPDDSTSTFVDISWTAAVPDGSPYPEYTMAVSKLSCCENFTIRAGESITINFSGRTEPANYTDYFLGVTVTNAQSPSEEYVSAVVTGVTDVHCGIFTCWEAPGGGGSTDIFLLIALCGVLSCRRLGYNRRPWMTVPFNRPRPVM